MVNSRTVACVFLVLIATFGQMGCEDSRQSEDDKPSKGKAARSQPVAAISKQRRVHLAELQVPRGTHSGHWVHMLGDKYNPLAVPFLWWYRGGEKIAFEQQGPLIFVSVDGKPFQLRGFILRSPDEIPVLSQQLVAAKTPLTVWVYGGVLPALNDLPENAAARVEAVHVWEREWGLVTSLSPLGHMKNLQALNIDNCEKLTSLAGLENLKNLKWVSAVSCELLGIKGTDTIIEYLAAFISGG